jgi:hypothetical protein
MIKGDDGSGKQFQIQTSNIAQIRLPLALMSAQSKCFFRKALPEPSLIRKPRSRFWFACFRDANGKQRRKSTKTTDRKKAMKIAEQFEQVGQRKVPPRTVRETLAELYREIYGEALPVATIRQFVRGWLKTKQPEVAPATLAVYQKSVTKFLDFLGPSASKPRL